VRWVPACSDIVPNLVLDASRGSLMSYGLGLVLCIMAASELRQSLHGTPPLVACLPSLLLSVLSWLLILAVVWGSFQFLRLALWIARWALPPVIIALYANTAFVAFALFGWVVGVLVLMALLAIGVCALYGGEDDESIRFMEPAAAEMAEPLPMEPTVTELNAAEQHYFEELASELRSLAQIPLVTAVSSFDHGDEMQQKGVLLGLDARFLSRSKARQIQVHCSEKEGFSRKRREVTQPKPTHLDAARAARAELERDYVDELAAAAAAGSSALAEQNAFDALRAAAAARFGLEKRVAAATEAMENACTAERAAVLAREAAESSLKQAKATLNAFGPSKKKQKTAGAGSSAEAAAGVEAAATEQEVADDEPTWREWALSRWRKHEKEMQKRRAVGIDESNTDKSLPPRGDEVRKPPRLQLWWCVCMLPALTTAARCCVRQLRGWRRHWRRGLYGAVQDWAEGSKFVGS
jgi:hypothetical protein